MTETRSIPDDLARIAKARGLRLSLKGGVFEVRDHRTTRLQTKRVDTLRSWLQDMRSVMVAKG